jgi:superfamily I DNA/RNA helicase
MSRPGQALSMEISPGPLHPAVAERLERLAPDQRAAATAPPGPILCIAPAGSGKTTTLVARIAWLVAGGVGPGAICAITFSRRAAEELASRVDEALEPLGVPAGVVRVRTFHALAAEILRETGGWNGRLADRPMLLRQLLPEAGPGELAQADTAISRLKVEHGARLEDGQIRAAAQPVAGRTVEVFAAYQELLEARAELDFDDLILKAMAALDADPARLEWWARRCRHLLVDEVQDVDRAQLELAVCLAAPVNRIFLVGDDDQSIYGWRLADVRRILDLDARLPGLRRVHLVTNYRCPRPVVERAGRLVAHSRERFLKDIRAGPSGAGRLILAPDGGDDDERLGRVLASWPDDNSSRAILARTNLELAPAAVAALEREIPFRASELRLPVEDPGLDDLLGRLEAEQAANPNLPLLVLVGRFRTGADRDLAAALAGWAPRYRDAASLARAVRIQRDRLARLRRSVAGLTLATAHATKGLEFDHVIVLMDADRFPSRRALDEAEDTQRALEEERRLAYVAWTRARRSLTLLYDPAAPSRFLAEAFSRAELGI